MCINIHTYEDNWISFAYTHTSSKEHVLLCHFFFLLLRLLFLVLPSKWLLVCTSRLLDYMSKHTQQVLNRWRWWWWWCWWWSWEELPISVFYLSTTYQISHENFKCVHIEHGRTQVDLRKKKKDQDASSCQEAIRSLTLSLERSFFFLSASLFWFLHFRLISIVICLDV